MDNCPWNGPHILEGGILKSETGRAQGWPRVRILDEGTVRDREADASHTYRKMLYSTGTAEMARPRRRTKGKKKFAMEARKVREAGEQVEKRTAWQGKKGI